MKRAVVTAFFAITFVSCSALSLPAQEVDASGPQLHPRPQAPNEQLLPPSSVAPFVVPNPKKYPQKYAAVYMPISLAAGRVRTPEFPVMKHSQWYDIVLQVEKPLPFRRMECMVGATSGGLDKKDCEKDDPIVRADWTVWEDGRIVEWGSMRLLWFHIHEGEHLQADWQFPLRSRQEICRAGALHEGWFAAQCRKPAPDRNPAPRHVVKAH